MVCLLYSNYFVAVEVPRFFFDFFIFFFIRIIYPKAVGLDSEKRIFSEKSVRRGEKKRRNREKRRNLCLMGI